jgi:hypothetical protein
MNFGSSVINGKEPHHEGHKSHQGERKGFISVVFLRDLCGSKKVFPLKTVDPEFLNAKARRQTP